MLLNNINTLGKRQCPRGYTWNQQGNYCQQTSGGGNRFFKSNDQLLGANTILTPAQISAMSVQGLQNIIANHQRRIAEIDARVAYEATLMYPWDDATKQILLNEKTQLLANIAAMQSWLALTPQQKAKTNGSTFIIKAKQKFLNTMNKITNSNNSDSIIPGSFIEDTTDFLTQQYAGVPVWGIVLLAGAGLYVFSSNKKKMKRA